MIELVSVSKQFPGVKALDGVSFNVEDGAVHGLVGENGAGKSTLIKILSGIYPTYRGKISIDNKKVNFKSVLDSQKFGVATIFQELTVIQDLSVAENIFLGREPYNSLGFLDFNEMQDKSRRVLEYLGIDFSPNSLIRDLSVANQQLVEICKALVIESKIIIMDEPTSALTEHEVEYLFALIEKLKSKGLTIIYVSHKLDEVFHLCDSITVLRDGSHIGTVRKDEVTQNDIITMMVGRPMNSMFPERKAERVEEILRVRGLKRAGDFEDIDFNLHGGEIVGFAGLIGAGRTELAKALIGAAKIDGGEILLRGRTVGFKDPGKALSSGLVYLTEDRKGEGLMLELGVRENMVVSILKELRNRLFISAKNEDDKVRNLVDKLKIKITDKEQTVENLSGGNQQKVIISRLLLTDSELFIFDEPTRGIDVGAKFEIYRIMNSLAEEGKGIIFISSELPEVLGVSDRIYCMREGRIVSEFTSEEATPENVMRVLTGGRNE